MEKPNYVFRTNEAVLMPVEKSKALSFLRKAVWIIIAAIVIGSLFFNENLFMELSWSSRVLLVVFAIGFTFVGRKTEYFPSPMELQFYDDYLVLYLPKRHCSKRLSRREIHRMNYADITKCVFKTKSQRIHIYGSGTATWYNFRFDGTLPQNPTKIRNYTDGLVYFNISLAHEVDFKKEIEAHSPIQVIVENS